MLTLGEAEFMVRASGYLKTLDDFRAIPLKLAGGVPVLLGDVAQVQLGPEMRRGVAELDGEGEAVGGVVILRSGKDVRSTLAAVHKKIAELRAGLPPGIEIVTTYDRSGLIDRAVDNLTRKLVEEFIVVALVCAVFLWHLRSAGVAIVALPLGVLIAFGVMRQQGLSANIMSLGGIAIAIGAMVDAAIVMIENAHKKIEAWQHAHPRQTLVGEARWRVMTEAAAEVGPALFFSLLIITVSFLPVFLLEAQEGRLFGPLAFTKTWAMAAAAGLSVTLVPVLMGYWIRGRLPDETRNPLNRVLIRLYRPLLDAVLAWPKLTLLVAGLVFLTALWPLARLGGEFLPPLDEGDLLYMPSALPGLSAQKASELLQQTDRLIKTVPEVARVLGKAGRADTATDPAPLEMFETTVQFKPREQWRPGMTPEKLLAELDRVVRVPGLTNVWIPPIRNRLDMLATGIKSPIGVKIAGSDLAAIDRVAQQVERVAEDRAGRDLRAGRAPHRRALRGHRHRPRRRCPLRSEHRRCAVGGGRPDRRRDHRRGHRRPRALPDQPALPARMARHAGAAAATALRHPGRQPDHPGHGRSHRHQRRADHAQERERPPRRLGLHRRPVAAIWPPWSAICAARSGGRCGSNRA